MPTVRSYGSQRVDVRPLPSARRTAVPSPEAFGAGLGEAAATVGIRGLSSQFQQQRDHADQVAQLEWNNKLSTWRNQRLLDPNTGALTIKGKDAFGLPEAVLGEFDTLAGEMSTTVSGERQRMAFERDTARMRESLDSDLRRHVSTQLAEFDANETKAFLGNALNDAVLAATEPRRVAESLTRGEAAIKDNAKRNGIGEEATKAALGEFRSNVHVGVIGRLLATEQDSGAQAYFDEVKDQIDAGAIARVESALAEGSLRGASQRESDAILATTKTATEARERVRSITDPKLRDAVDSRVEHGLAIRDQADVDSHRELMVSVGNMIDKSGLRAVPPTIWSTLTVQEKSGFEAYAKRNATGSEAKTNPLLWYDLRKMASESPDAFKKLALAEPKYLNALGKTEWKQIADLQADMLKGQTAKAEEQLDGFRSNQQIADEALTLAGINTGDNADARKSGDLDRRARFYRELDRKVASLQNLTGKKVGNEDVRRLSDELLMSVTLDKGSWWNILPGGKPFGAVSKRLMDITIADVPGTERSLIEQALRKAGRDVSDAAIVRLYVQQKQFEAGK